MADRLTTPDPSPAERALQLWLDRREEDVDWTRLAPGPTVAEVATRLTAAPRAFLAEVVDLPALGGDVLAANDTRITDGVDRVLRVAQGWVASRQGAALGLWLYASEDRLGPLSRPLRRETPDRLLAALGLRLAAIVDPYRWLVEADRREEAARVAILWSDQRPSDEDAATAYGRWVALDSLRRDRALQATLTDYRHRQEVMRRLQEQRAREAAARYTPE